MRASGLVLGFSGLLSAGFIAGFCSAGCSFFQSPQGQGTIATIADVTVCILNHSQESVTQIASACGPQATVDVINKILDAHHAAEIREKAAAK